MTPGEFSTVAVAWIGSLGIVVAALTGMILTLLKHAKDIQNAWDTIHMLQRHATRIGGPIDTNK
jgi:hypothetical protein